MSVKIIACLNPVSSERAILEANPGSIKEIINSLDTGFTASHARVCRNGEIIKDFSTEAKDGDTLWIKFVPHGNNEQIGSGMKLGGAGLITIGLIITGFLGWTGIGGGIGVALIGTGVSMFLGGAVVFNASAPLSKDPEKPDQDHSIRGAKNQARPYGRIPVLFGKHRIYPDLAANQYTEIKGNQQYFIQLFSGGYNDYTIDLDSIKLGDVPLIDLSQTKDIQKILAGADSAIDLEIIQNGKGSRIYPSCVHEEVLNAPLQKEIKDAEGNIIPGEIICKTPDKTDSINVDIFLQNGIGKYNSEGKLGSWSVEVEALYKGSDNKEHSLGFLNGNSNTISGSELKMKRYQITKNNLPPDKYTVIIKRVTADSKDSKIVDMVHVGSVRSKKTKDANGNVIRPIREARQKDLTIIAMKVLATSRLNNVLDSFNYVATSKLPVYSKNGSGPLYWLNTAETRNPAAMLLHALRGRASQQIVDPDDIDWPSIEKFYLWCEEHEYTCNAYLSESVTIAELIRMIGNTSRADILRIDSKISVVQDIERPSCMQLFTPKNTVGYSITMFNADIPDSIALRFIDESVGFTHNELSVYNTPNGNKIDEPESIQKVDLWGITDNKQARRIGMYNYACLKNRPFVHTIETDIEYLCVNKGDWIQYAGDIALTGSAQGRIKGIIWADDVCIGIDTDEPVIMTEGQRHAVRIRMSDGTIILKEVVYNPGLRREKSITYYPVDEGDDLHEPSLGEIYAVDEDNAYYEPQNVIYFTEPVEAKNAPKAGNIYAFGVRGYEVIDLIITDIQPGQNLSATLTCVEYSPLIFDVDKPDFILPEFENKITPVSGAVDHGVVNPDNWKHFTVYHDSEEEPARPFGNGQGDGWYNEQTFRSIWQSSKTAESIESGEWSLPVRIKAQRGTDDVTPIWLSLSPQNVTLETDGDGNVLVALFPIKIQARLFQWNSVLSGVVYSLTGTPAGISINSNGLVTVNANADLGVDNKIKVNAEYQGAVYSSDISIKKNIRNHPADYLGTVQAITLNDERVIIISGGPPGEIRAQQGDYVLSITAVGGEQAGSVFQWTGVTWVYCDPIKFTDLYSRCFMDGLEVSGLANNVQWVGALFASRIAAAEAFIKKLQTQLIELQEGGIIKSAIYNTDKGFQIVGDTGEAVFNDIVARGHVDAKSGSFKDGVFTDIRITGNSILSGDIETDVFQVMPSQVSTFNTSGYTVSSFIAKLRADLNIPSTTREFALFPISSSAHPNFGSIIIRVRIVEVRVFVLYANGTEIAFTGSTFSYNFSFTIGTTNRTIKMLKLPESTAIAGTVIKQDAGDGYSWLKIKN